MSGQRVSWIKENAKRVVAPLARVATRNSARVLMYHRFGPGDPDRRLNTEDLDLQLRFLRRHFNVLPLRELVLCLRSGTPLQPRTVVLTVDDAYADFGEQAYPVFRKHGVPVTIYVVSEFAGGNFWLWWDAIRHLLDKAENGDFGIVGPQSKEIEISLGDRASRLAAWQRLAGICVGLSPAERDEFMRDLPHTLSVTLPTTPPREFAAMNWDELRALDSDIVEIGAHTCTHPILSQCDTERIGDEVAGSKAAIESRIGRKVTAFCYPNGEWSDVDERCISAVESAGFDNAVMACGGMVRQGSNLYALERMSVPHRISDFKSDVSGISYLRRRASHGAGASFR